LSLTEQTAPISVPTDELIETIIDSIQDIKGNRIVKIDLRDVDEAPTDYFIICEGESTTQVKGISDRVHLRVRDELGMTAGHVEGQTYARWILMDYFDVIVHVFYPEARFFYDLEDLWSDGITTEYENL
jgi:ribosome-associated protein